MKQSHPPAETTTQMPWDTWLAELNSIAGDAYGSAPMSKQTGEECWREFYDDGYSPQEAWDEDCAAGL